MGMVYGKVVPGGSDAWRCCSERFGLSPGRLEAGGVRRSSSTRALWPLQAPRGFGSLVEGVAERWVRGKGVVG